MKQPCAWVGLHVFGIVLSSNVAHSLLVQTKSESRKINTTKSDASPIWTRCGRPIGEQPAPNAAYYVHAFGEKAVDKAYWQMRMLREVGHDVCDYEVMTDNHTKAYALTKNFSKVTVWPEENLKPEVAKLFHTDYEVHGVKAMLLNMMPPVRDEFLMMNLHVLPVANMSSVWSKLRSWSTQNYQDIVALGSINDCGWHWGQLCKIRQNNSNLPMEKVHNGIMYVRSEGSSLERFRQYFTEGVVNYDMHGFLRFFEGGMTDEILTSYAFAKLGYRPLELFEEEDGALLATGDFDVKYRLAGVPLVNCYTLKAFRIIVSNELHVPVASLPQGEHVQF